MNRELTLKHLAQAEAAAAQGLQHIAKQRSKIKKLRRNGHDAIQSIRVLLIFLDFQRSNDQHRKWLQAELSKMSAAAYTRRPAAIAAVRPPRAAKSPPRRREAS